MAGPNQGMPTMQMGQMPGMHMQPVQQNPLQVPLGPPQGNPQQPQHPGPAQVQQAHPQQPDNRPLDPITRFRTLLPRLKESLVNLFKTGAHLFYQNAHQDTGAQKDNVNGRFEKCLEEFYAICDQLEISLRLAHEIIQQDKDSQRNTPNSTVPPKADPTQPEGQVYSQYLSTVRVQIGCAKEIRDLLLECLKNFPEHPHS
ncbi:hypothetical protein EGW08_018429 [Elysia chlorotica]|uniref:Mediator of RNA polymerase II transcription subunit 29 n=1 Tax=Elysia chlorotica TaxID=188477 RepID=A0A3S1H7L0_ELYCH|nr:hypothetical protein EGW08_018429 [Elysia chlorotica]